MTTNRVLLLTVAIFALHALEEYVTAFYTTDLTVLWLASVLSVAPLAVWSAVEVVIFAFLGSMFAFPKNKVLWAILLLFMAAQLYHLALAIFANTYSGVLTTVLFVPLLWFTYRASPFGTKI
jgi:hypothetical protein